MSVYYCFIAVDSDMIIFEKHCDKNNQVKAMESEVEIHLNKFERDHGKSPEHDEENVYHESRVLHNVLTPGDNKTTKMNTIFKVIHFGIITDHEFDDRKANKFLLDFFKSLEKHFYC